MTGEWPESGEAKGGVDKPGQNGHESEESQTSKEKGPRRPPGGGSEEYYTPAARNWKEIREDVIWVY